MPGFFNDMMLMDRCSSATATSNGGGGGGGLGDARAFQLALELSMLGIGDPLLSNGTANTSSSSTSATSNNNGIIITNGNNTNSNSSSNHLHNNGSNNSNGHLHNHHHHHHHLHHLSDDQQLQHQQQQPDSPTTVNDLGSFVLGGNGCGLGPLGLVDEVRSKKSQNMTECVPVPSSEHVAEIVGRQGCKIKALRAKTNTYIKTPVRGEEPVFVVTGRKEDVAKAKREILSAAEHFSQIRASRKNNNLAGLMNGCGGAGAGGGLTGLSGLNGGCGGSGASTPPGPAALNNAVNQNVPGHVTIQVRVPYRVVGLVVGPKGATIKRIQHQTHTYIVTPSRDKEPVFEVTGLPESVETARREIEAHIAMRTGATSTTSGNGVGASGGGGGIGSSSSSFNCLNASSSSSMMGSNAIVSSAFGANCFGGGCLDDATSDILASLCKTGLNSLFNYIEPSSNGGGSNAIAMSGVSMLTSECDANQSDSVVSFPLMMTSSSASTSSSSSSSSSSGIGYPSNGSNSTSGAFFSGSSSSSCSSSSGGGSGGGGRNGDLGAIWSSALTNDRDEGLGDSPSFDTAAVTAAAIMMSTVSATSSSSSSTNGNHGGASTNNNIWSYPSSSSPSSSSASSASSSSTATASSSSAIIVAPPSSSLSPNSGSPIDSLLGNSGGGAAGAPVAKCLVCVEAKVTHALVPCGHNFFCMDCARRVCDNGGNNGGGNGNGGESQCPVCSLPALQAIRIYSPNP